LATNIKVFCYAGYRGDESPIYFYVGGRKVTVSEIADSWIGPDHRYFKVKGDDGAVYILRQDTCADTWELTMFDRVVAKSRDRGER